jgi:tetratricopeptide (TPR) repeat protein
MLKLLQDPVQRLAGILFAVAVIITTLPAFFAAGTSGVNDLRAARNRQDLAALDRNIAQCQQAAQANAQSADAQYRAALAYSYAAEVALELRDKKKSETYAEGGMDYARKAVSANGSNAESHRLLGELCGQVIPANPLMGSLKYGPCARDEINKALELDNKLALAYVSRGVGNFYLPAAMGGGIDLALKDLDKAISINPKLPEAYLWKGIALRKANRNAEARQALQQALQTEPNRVWIKQELDKTPAQ